MSEKLAHRASGANLAAVFAVALAIIAALFSASAYARPLPLRLIRDYPLPGRTTRFDYESFDPKSGLLFIAHLGDSEVLVFDTKSQKLVAKVPGVSQVHGVLAVPSLNRVYASATGVNRIFAIDERDFRIIARIPGGNYPDGLAFDPGTHELFVSDELGRTDTVIDTSTERRIATIDLGGEAGNTQFDPVSGRMYVDVQTLDRLVAIDPRTNTVAASYPLPGCKHDHGLYIDAVRRLAFVACDGNDKLLTFDLRTMRVTGIHSVGHIPDVLAFDTDLRRLYVASESGVVAAFEEKGRGVVKIGESYVAREAHSVAVDSRDRVYFPLQNSNGRPVLRIMAPTDEQNTFYKRARLTKEQGKHSSKCIAAFFDHVHRDAVVERYQGRLTLLRTNAPSRCLLAGTRISRVDSLSPLSVNARDLALPTGLERTVPSILCDGVFFHPLFAPIF